MVKRGARVQTRIRERWTVGYVAALVPAAFVVAVAHRWIPEANYLMVHLMLLGAVTTAILIWSAHFADTLLAEVLPRMTGAAELQVPLVVESGVGDNWDEAH